MRRGLAALAAVALGGLVASSATAQDCHSKAVTAKGTPALIEASAKSRARSAWIKRVRAHRLLGPNYAAWLRSKDPSYLCRKAGKSLICDATAIPCKV